MKHKKHKIKISKAISFDVWNLDSYGERKSYRAASPAAKAWSETTAWRWAANKYNDISWKQMLTLYKDDIENRIARLYKKSYPIFKQMLK